MNVVVKAIVAVAAIALGVSADCSCPAVEFGRRLSSKRPVVFEAANVRAEDYQRPVGGSGQYTSPLREAEPTPGCDSEQIHVTLGDLFDSVIVSFTSASNSSLTPSVVFFSKNQNDLVTLSNSASFAKGSSEVYSELIYITSYEYNPPMGVPPVEEAEIIALENTADWAIDKKTGTPWANYNLVTSAYTGSGQYNNPYMYYDSPMVHTVPITGLELGVTYYYRVAGSCTIYQFKIPAQLPYASKASLKGPQAPSPYPMVVALTGDLGQTEVSSASIAALDAMKPDVILLVGDLSYADGYMPRWDTFGRLIEPLAAIYPMMTTGGNHEVGFGETWVSYAARFPTPHKGSGSPSICYWGREVGVTHVIAICSYAGFDENSLQYQWLSNYLATQIDRTRTPWVVAMMHTPWYNSNKGHWMEGELYRRTMEALLYQYGVDVVLSGHVHSYERTLPVFNNTLDECGPVYLNLGDGGNYEGATHVWWNNSDTETGSPEWSAFREGSFGVGGLVILNATHLEYSWHRHACGSDQPGSYAMNFSDDCVTPKDNSAQRMLTSDVVVLSRPPSDVCPNRWLSTAVDQAVVVPDDSSNNGPSTLVIALSVGIAFIGCYAIIVSILLYRSYTAPPDTSAQDTKYRLLG